jgi:hypothetical protein
VGWGVGGGGCGLWCVGGGLWAVGCGLWAVGCGLWAVGCGLWAVGCGLWAVGCGLWAVGCGCVWVAGCGTCWFSVLCAACAPWGVLLQRVWCATLCRSAHEDNRVAVMRERGTVATMLEALTAFVEDQVLVEQVRVCASHGGIE